MSITDDMKKSGKKQFKLRPDITFGGIVYSYVPGPAFGRAQGLYVARTGYGNNGARMVNVSWYEAKLAAEKSDVRLPTNFEWSRIRKYAEFADLKLERGMISVEEWTDTIIDFREGPRLPIAWDRLEAVKKDDGTYDVTGGSMEWAKRPERLPVNGWGEVIGIESWDDETELPAELPPERQIDEHRFYGATLAIKPEGMKPVIRGYDDDGHRKLTGRYTTQINIDPDFRCEFLGFRTVIDEDMVKKGV